MFARCSMRRAVVRVGCILAVMGLASSRVAGSSGELIRASSVHSETYPAKYAVDGEHKTRWASRPFGDGPEWLQIDFGKTIPVNRVMIRWERACAKAYQLQLSDDGQDWRTVHENRECEGGNELITGLEAEGRYVRVLCLQPGPYKLVSVFDIEFPGEGPAAAILAKARRRAAATRRRAETAARRRLSQVAAEHDVKEIIFAMRQPGKDGHWYANFSYYADDQNRLTYGQGGKLCRLNLQTGLVTAILEDAQGAVRDPVVHYDAQKVLFSYRKGDSPYYHLYEINLDGSGLRQLTEGPYDDIEPCYLPDDSIVFVSSRCKRWVNCWLTKVAVMYRCGPHGQNIRPISSNVEHDNTPWPLPDGRILYQRWEYIDRSQVHYHHLWTTNPDGTGQMTYYGNMHPGIVMIDAKPIPNTKKVVAIFSPGHGRREHVGTITVVDPRSGPDDESSAISITSAAKYRDPWAFSEETFLAARGERLVLLDNQGHTREIHQATAEEAAAGLECHEPRPIIQRRRERVVPGRANRTEATGTVVLMDVYKGRNMAGVERGEIEKLLVVESLPKPINFTGGMDPLTYGGSFTLERALGTIPVEEDGSAFAELPALRSLFFVALDENDMAVKRMQSFMTVQPGELTGCVGCHERRTQSLLPNLHASATSRPASKIQPIADTPEVFDFPRDIQPILNKLCVDCHGYEKTEQGGPHAGQVILTGDHGPMFSHAYFTMTVEELFSDGRNRAVSNYAPREIGSSASRVLRMLDGSHHGVEASQSQKKILRLWIETGAPYPGTYAALGTGSIGGYQQNKLVNTDFDWPTTQAGAEVIERRCASCHTENKVLPTALSDERGVSFWRFDVQDPRLQFARHIVFNLSRPEKSLMLLAPLTPSAGGFGLCRDQDGEPAGVFQSPNDPDYQTLLSMIEAGQQNLQTIKRFDMVGFQPRPEYLREMRHYGMLPKNHPDDRPVDPYELDQRYWESLWHRPATEQ